MGSCSVAGLPTGANPAIWLEGVGKVSAQCLVALGGGLNQCTSSWGPELCSEKAINKVAMIICNRTFVQKKLLVFVFFSVHTF